jgi:hypothetical protein
MKITHTMVVMFVGSLLIQYFLMPPLMVNSFENITNNIGKVYLSIIMGLFMVLVEIFMHDMHYGIVSFTKYGIIISMIILFIYLYRNQVAIKDKDFLNCYSQSDWIICDSKILNLGAKFLGKKIVEVIPGSSFFPAFYNYHKDNHTLPLN